MSDNEAEKIAGLWPYTCRVDFTVTLAKDANIREKQIAYFEAEIEKLNRRLPLELEAYELRSRLSSALEELSMFRAVSFEEFG